MVYFLVKGSKTIYIGHTKNLKQRIPNHREKNYDYVRWMYCKSKKRVLFYEKRWQERFKPELNKHGISDNRMITTKTRSIKLDKTLLEQFDTFAKSKGETFNSMLVNYIKRVTPKTK